jgi:hypothetical protein
MHVWQRATRIVVGEHTQADVLMWVAYARAWWYIGT